jgi:hypothetical protein
VGGEGRDRFIALGTDGNDGADLVADFTAGDRVDVSRLGGSGVVTTDTADGVVVSVEVAGALRDVFVLFGVTTGELQTGWLIA